MYKVSCLDAFFVKAASLSFYVLQIGAPVESYTIRGTAQKSEAKSQLGAQGRAEASLGVFTFFLHTEGEIEELRGKLEVETRGWMSIVTVINIVTCTGDHRMDALLLLPCTRVFFGRLW